jgi:ParB-like chromosome segregation protein Spo0J
MAENRENPKVELWQINKVTPSPRNPRTHSDAQVAQIVASMREWGWTVPLLVDEKGQLIAGHGRLLAAQQLKLKSVPAIVARGWTEAQKRAYIIADNKIALNSAWDLDLLALELDDIAVADFNMDLLGFSDDDLARLQTDIDEAALNKIAGNQKPIGAEDGPIGATASPLADGNVAFSLVMAAEARRVLQQAIGQMKTRDGMETSAEALVLICREWMDDHVADA